MCETVLEYFKSIHVARDIRDGVEYRNEATGELVFRDAQFDSEAEWRLRGVWDVCCLTRLTGDDGLEYDMGNDDDVSIPEIALRIVTEDGWKRA